MYESVLDYVPACATTTHRRDSASARRRSAKGNRLVLHPTVADRLCRAADASPARPEAPADRILKLRVVDPAMGSAAFLVSACRYLARAYERALVREEACREADLDESDRAGFRRQIAQRCLFGVDLNPTAVQLARLSLWLATLSANKPLTFLDHRLVCGDSLLGASPVDVARQPPPAAGRDPRRVQTQHYFPTRTSSCRSRARSGHAAGSPKRATTRSRSFERKSDASQSPERRMRWKAMADLWCACWMWPDDADAPGPSGVRIVDR